MSSAAQKHTDNMAKTQALDHELGGTTPDQRVKAENYTLKSVNEIIFRSDRPATADAAMPVQVWMRSTTGHREAILDPQYVHIGVGVQYSSKGVPYYSAVFARPSKR